MEKFALLIGRILLAHIFLISGITKIGNYAGTQAYMDSVGVPGALLPLVILTEILFPIAMIIGWQTRLAALALAGFTLLSALFFHTNFADQMQLIQFMKNLAITGGLIVVAAVGAGALSVDQRRGR